MYSVYNPGTNMMYGWQAYRCTEWSPGNICGLQNVVLRHSCTPQKCTSSSSLSQRHQMNIMSSFSSSFFLPLTPHLYPSFIPLSYSLYSKRNYWRRRWRELTILWHWSVQADVNQTESWSDKDHVLWGMCVCCKSSTQESIIFFVSLFY